MMCRVCDSARLETVLDLGNQPWGNDFLAAEQVGREPLYPLRLVYCRDCSTAQLDYTVKKEIMFGDHTYLSGMTRTLNDHFRSVAQDVDSRFFRGRTGKSVLDIGSNDGTQLRHYMDLGYDALGVESSVRTARMANQSGVPTINQFFNLEAARSLGKKFDVVNASGIFFHLEELHSVSEGIREVLKEDGLFVVQFIYMKAVLENLAFDQIYHEHLLYYNLETIEKLLRRHGLSMFDAYFAPIHGGSVMGFVTHERRAKKSARLLSMLEEERASRANELASYRAFAEGVGGLREREISYIRGAKKAGKRIYGFGAPVKGNTLLNYFGIGTDCLDFLVEKNPLRKGLYSPGTHIPIIMESEVKEPPDIYYVLAWNFRKEILQINQPLIDQGVEFHFPINPKGFP